jgi:hypothetical protein
VRCRPQHSRQQQTSHPTRTVQTPGAQRHVQRSRATVATLCRRWCPASNRVRCPRSPSTSVHPGHVERPSDHPGVGDRAGWLQTTRGTCPAVRSAAVGVRRGVRSRRPAGQARVSILDDCPGGVSEWVSGRRSGASIPTAARAWLGAGEQDKPALAIGEAALGPDHPSVAGYPRQPRCRASGPQARTS